MAPPALVTMPVVVVAVATVVDIVENNSKKSNYIEFLASEVVKLRGTTTWVHDCKGVSEIVRQEFDFSSPDLS